MCEVLPSFLSSESLRLVSDDQGKVGTPPAFAYFHGVQWPLPPLPAVSVPPHLFFWFFFFLMNVSICMAVLCSRRVHPSSKPPSTATSRQITNPMCTASPQQMWLSEASAVDLLSPLACTLHSSQRNPGFLLTCQVKLGHSSSWASCFVRTHLRQQTWPLWVSCGRKRA